MHELAHETEFVSQLHNFGASPNERFGTEFDGSFRVDVPGMQLTANSVACFSNYNVGVVFVKLVGGSKSSDAAAYHQHTR
ncbi:hypothetical protein GCM10011410_10180 [Hoyosella rhizosphaerae]|uniref:Uncharacterized protein n=1 Tax=Hoyosella rhizosphaerae TaxID=1755582 RepID=A0A916XBK7_9ACTN|nr:hypothetical protein GCM10011410_10180 [Hoyosella rhizosphaerae]